MSTPPRPRSWLRDLPRRARLEAAARAAYPSMRYRRRQRVQGPVHVYVMQLAVPGYEPRIVTVEFDDRYPHSPAIYADGPAGPDASPHRYSDRGYRWLCVWYPSDPPARRWVPDDGLLALLGMTAHHLLK